MIIYRDITNQDELLADTFKIIDVGDGLWEVDLKMVTVGSEDFVLEGANASAEGEDAEEAGGETEVVRVLDIQNQMRLQPFPAKPSKKEMQGIFKTYMKKVLATLTEKKAPAEDIANFKKGAPAAVKKILGNWDNYDVYLGEHEDQEGMYVLVDFREDGSTPYATFWKYGLEEYKV